MVAEPVVLKKISGFRYDNNSIDNHAQLADANKTSIALDSFLAEGILYVSFIKMN